VSSTVTSLSREAAIALVAPRRHSTRHGGGLGSPMGWVGSVILRVDWVELGWVESDS